MKNVSVFWFRRDLRLDDNTALKAALARGNEVLPIFIFDQNLLSELPSEDARVTFIHNLLTNIQLKLFKIDRSLATFFDSPENVFTALAEKYDIESVFANHDYEPYAIKRDIQIGKLLKEKNIGFYTFKDQVIFERDEVVKDDANPYVVFTPYANKWKSKLSAEHSIYSTTEYKTSDFVKHDIPFLSLEAIGFTPSSIRPKPFQLSEELLRDYAAKRDFPAINATSGLSPYLRFGAVSIREIVSYALANNQKFLSELIWREFFMQILWHFSHTVTKSFKPQYDQIRWRNNESEFKKWCEGKTGYPIVDAGMRELNATGIMHNRVRMITAGFLCKHLLIDWRWGEAYFAEKLLDYEQASNVGNWQWAAGSGVDAAPYFRIFNPTEQVKKFDKELKYIRKWVPEIDDFSYPPPIVDHREARERCLTVYREGLEQ